MPSNSSNVDELNYIITHAFFPPKLPQKSDQSCTKDHALCYETYQCAKIYQSLLPSDQRTRWTPILQMLRNLCSSQESDALSAEQIQHSMTEMKPGGKNILSSFSFIELICNLRCASAAHPRPERCHHSAKIRE